MVNHWFKFYGGEYLSDPKIERLSPLERSCWITLLCLASMNGAGEIEFLTVETLLNKSGIQFDPYHPEEWEKALGVLTKFQNLKMISVGDDGIIKMTNWVKRQETALTNAERQARYRQRNEKVTERVTEVTLDKNRIEKKNTPADADFFISKEEEKPRKVKEPANKRYAELCDWLSNLTGAPMPNRVKQYKFLSDAKTAGIDPDRLMARAEELWRQDFYQENGMDWGSVVSSFNRKA